MKIRAFLVLGLIVIAAFGQVAYAEDHQQGQGGGQHHPGGGKMNPMMMGMMNKPTMLATSDGGVVILEGHRLIKYDASLTLVKEAELPKGKKLAGQQQSEGSDGEQAPPPQE